MSTPQLYLKALSKRRDAENVTVADSGHGHHEEVDAVPISQALAVVKVRRVPRVLQQVDNAWGTG